MWTIGDARAGASRGGGVEERARAALSGAAHSALQAWSVACHGAPSLASLRALSAAAARPSAGLRGALVGMVQKVGGGGKLRFRRGGTWAMTQPHALCRRPHQEEGQGPADGEGSDGARRCGWVGAWRIKPGADGLDRPGTDSGLARLGSQTIRISAQ